ncbi:MAG: hypothetical protein KGD72_00050 [Candidatus Lokiarchaeota archaeon]|nr:hypothetical protein [Candidatus Lokiarchaeota archaeon]
MITKQKVNTREVFGLDQPLNLFSKWLGRVLFYSSASYIVLLVLNVLLSSFFGFSLTVNYISDLGSINVIPFPYIHNLICIFGGAVSLPVNFFVRKKLRIVYKSSRFSLLFVELGVALGVIGNVGYMFLGVFSLDRAGPGDIYHGIITFISFGGYILSIFFFSLNIVLSHKCKLKHLGIFGLTIPITLLIVYCALTIPLMEWFLLSSILAFLLLLNYYVFKL